MIKTAIIMFLMSSAVFSQVNTEALRKSTDKKGFANMGLATIGLNSGNSEFYSVSLLARSDYLDSPFNAFAVASYDYKRGGGKSIVHKAFAHIRAMYYFSDAFSGETFVQKEFNEFLKVNDRNLFGLSGRFKAMDITPETDSMSNAVMYLGLGLMFENENIGTENPYIKNLVRSTNYVNFRWTLKNVAIVQSVAYLQVNTKRISDFRLTNETSVEFVITKYLKFLTSMKYRYDNDPPVNVKGYDLELSNGIKVEF